jgi:hypothetical protein
MSIEKLRKAARVLLIRYLHKHSQPFECGRLVVVPTIRRIGHSRLSTYDFLDQFSMPKDTLAWVEKIEFP